MPDGPVQESVELVRTLLADCASFRTWIHATGSAASQRLQAFGKIYQIYLDPPVEVDGYEPNEIRALRPYASIDLATDEPYVRDAVAAQGDGSEQGLDSGSIILEFHENIPVTDINHPREAIMAFRRILGAILDEMIALSGTAGAVQYILIMKYQLFGPIQVSVSDDSGSVKNDDNMVAILQLDWGQAR